MNSDRERELDLVPAIEAGLHDREETATQLAPVLADDPLAPYESVRAAYEAVEEQRASDMGEMHSIVELARSLSDPEPPPLDEVATAVQTGAFLAARWHGRDPWFQREAERIDTALDAADMFAGYSLYGPDSRIRAADASFSETHADPRRYNSWGPVETVEDQIHAAGTTLAHSSTTVRSASSALAEQREAMHTARAVNASFPAPARSAVASRPTPESLTPRTGHHVESVRQHERTR